MNGKQVERGDRAGRPEAASIALPAQARVKLEADSMLLRSGEKDR